MESNMFTALHCTTSLLAGGLSPLHDSEIGFSPKVTTAETKEAYDRKI